MKALRSVNIVVGSVAFLLCWSQLIYWIFRVWNSNAVSLSVLALPVLIPLLIAGSAGVFPLFDYHKHFQKIRTWFFSVYVGAALLSLVLYLFLPMIPFFVVLIPYALIVSFLMRESNIGWVLLITNSILAAFYLWVFIFINY